VSLQPGAHLRLPTLTDEVQIEGQPASGEAAVAPLETGVMDVVAPPPVAAEEDEIVARVLADLQRQIDLTLEYRIREALVPTLARISDMLIRETRVDLAGTLHDVVARAVAQEVARRRAR
jgi:hypothetical protein